MALQTFVGNFTQPTLTNATFAVTGTGFTPKALILFATDETGVGVSTNIAEHIGMATSTTNRASISTAQTTATNTVARAHDDTKCFIVVSAGNVVLVKADLVSFDANGFTLNFSTVDLVGRIISYVALGGSDLTNAFIKEFLPAASNTNQSFTGVGFKPDSLFLMSSTVGTAPPANDNGACASYIGFGISSSNRSAIARRSFQVTESSQVQTEVIQQVDAAGAITQQADMVSMDADGFTLNFTVTSTRKYCFALCLKGGQYKIGTFNQSASTGNQGVTGIGFQPTGVILASQNLVTTAGVVTTSARRSLGAASSSSARASMWNGGGNAGVCDNDIDTGKIINMITEGATPTTNASADFVSMDSGGFTINNTTTDATSREVVYFAMGSNTTTAPTLFARGLLGVGL